MTTFPSASTGLLDAHIPLNQPPDLAFGVAARDHAGHELAVLLLGLAVLLGTEGDHREQILHLGEYPLFDNFADLFVGGPARILAGVLGPRAERELHDFVTEILRVGDTGGLFDLGQLLIEQLAVPTLAGV